MAAAASSSSSSSPPDCHVSSYSGEWEYDIFLCFRGGDTRLGFTSHLLAALADKKIKAFIDTMLRKTESIDELTSVLRRSALSIVIFSENFADSTWCLDEVATIAQSIAEFGHRALPVFYKVGWSDVAGDSGRYSAFIADELEASSEDNKRWRDALKAVANCAGHTSTATPIESKLIKGIVEDVQKLLIDMSPSIKSENLVGMGSRVLEVERLLAMDEVGFTRIIGLWGMGGAGKTTLAKACYERIVSSTTKGVKHHFIRNINENCEKQGIDAIVYDLYSKVLSESNLSHEDLDMHYRRARLSRSKVFIVLDDVETSHQLEQLFLGDVFNLTKLFATGSRIIVTTRNKKVLQNAMAKVYRMECLNDDESMQLFSLRAFRHHSPPDDWMNLSSLATSFCKGNPLVLRVLGGTLFGEDRDYWESFLSGLRLTENPEIRDVLKRSYDKLGADEKRLFLDVAFFLHGIPRSRLVIYMATMYSSAHSKVKDLIDRSLLTCISSEDGEKIEVHNLLKEMAVSIGKRTRSIDPNDVHNLLATTEVESWTTFFMKPFKVIETMVTPRRKKSKVTDVRRKGDCALEGLRTTEGISLDLSEVKEMLLKANAFEGMDSLTFLKFWWPEHGHPTKKKIYLPYGGLDSLPDGLRWLHWDGYPSRSLPTGFCPQHLVYLILRDSPIEKCWEGYDQPKLASLMVLDLSRCSNLTTVPDLSYSLKLEELLLRECSSLVEVSSHVQYLDKLITLDLAFCKNLVCLPPELNSKFLNHVRLNNCPKVEHCPEINSGELMELHLAGTPVTQLPNAIYSIKEGGRLYISGKNITSFPAIPTSLYQFSVRDTAIKEINSYDHYLASSKSLPKYAKLLLAGNSQLKSLPMNIWNLVSYGLIITGSPLLESLPEISEPVNDIIDLSITYCEGLKSLPSSIKNLVSLEYLYLGSTGIKSLPSSIQELDRLNSMDLSNCESLEYIPSSIHALPELYSLSLRGCRSMPSLPELPPSLSRLDVGGCKSLQALPSSASELRWLSLRFEGCPQLDMTVPDEIVAKFPMYASSSLYFERSYELLYSGSEIPKWFAFKSMNDKDASCLTVQLPPANCTGKQLIKGIAFGVVWSWNAPNRYLTMKCDCHIATITVASWSSSYLPPDPWDGTNSSDQVLLWLDRNSLGKAKERKKGEAWYLKYAGHTVSFRFYLYLGDGKDVKQWTKKFKIKRCGISLVY